MTPTIAALFYIDDSNPPPPGTVKYFAPQTNQIGVKYVQLLGTGQWIIAFDQPIDPSQYIAFVTTNGLHGHDTNYAYGIVTYIHPESMRIDTYGRSHLAAYPDAPWENSMTSFVVMMLQIPPSVGFGGPVLLPGQTPPP